MTQQPDAIAFLNFEAYAVERLDHDVAGFAGADLPADVELPGGERLRPLAI